MLSFLSNLRKQNKNRKNFSESKQRNKYLATKHLTLEPLEKRELLTVLYWDTNGATPGFGGGGGWWNLTDKKWSTSPDGTANTQAWIQGSDAVISANASSTISLDGSSISVGTVAVNSGSLDVYGHSLTVSGLTGYGKVLTSYNNGPTLTIAGNNRDDAFYGGIQGGLNLVVTTPVSHFP